VAAKLAQEVPEASSQEAESQQETQVLQWSRQEKLVSLAVAKQQWGY
jgi:hypothetical protein